MTLVPIRIRRRHARVEVARPSLRDLVESAVRGVAGDTVADFVGDLVEEATQEIGRGIDAPFPPYWQLDDRCPQCRLRLYESGNQIVICLACWVRFDRGAPEKPEPVSRAYKVPRARRSYTRSRPDPRTPPRTQRGGLPAEVAQALRTLSLQHPTDELAVRRRRKELAFQHHPDRGGDVSKLIEANMAADVLLDFYAGRE